MLETVREIYENMTEPKTDCKGCWGEEELYYNLSVNSVQGSDTFKADLESAIIDEYNKKIEYAKSQKK